MMCGMERVCWASYVAKLLIGQPIPSYIMHQCFPHHPSCCSLFCYHHLYWAEPNSSNCRWFQQHYASNQFLCSASTKPTHHAFCVQRHIFCSARVPCAHSNLCRQHSHASTLFFIFLL